jgi:hypothetical protein
MRTCQTAQYVKAEEEEEEEEKKKKNCVHNRINNAFYTLMSVTITSGGAKCERTAIDLALLSAFQLSTTNKLTP